MTEILTVFRRNVLKGQTCQAEIDFCAGTQLLQQAIAVGELQAQKERLDIYTVQARFALAAIYDQAATLGEATVE